MILHLVHPPAIANTVVVFFAQPDWSFLLFPTLVGAVLLVLIAIIYHNVRHDVHYPNYW
jgi:CBS-domain-containing membrane protein